MAFPSSLVEISGPFIVPVLSVLTNFAPIICTPVSGSPVSVSSIMVILLGLSVEGS